LAAKTRPESSVQSHDTPAPSGATASGEHGPGFDAGPGWSVVATLVLLVVVGLVFRASHLGAISFAEDEVNKVEAVVAYGRGDITANAEHPMLMKALMYASVKVGRALQGAKKAIGDETLFRLPNAIFGALTVCDNAPRGAIIAHETPAATRYYLSRFGRTDLNSIPISSPDFEVANLPSPAYIIVQRGRTYFENRDEIALVRNTFKKLYEVKVNGMTAAEVFVNETK